MSRQASKEDCDRLGAYLPCPECDWLAIPASRLSYDNVPSWCEDDEADCPGCGLRLRANITGDGESDFMEAILVSP